MITTQQAGCGYAASLSAEINNSSGNTISYISFERSSIPQYMRSHNPARENFRELFTRTMSLVSAYPRKTDLEQDIDDFCNSSIKYIEPWLHNEGEVPWAIDGISRIV